MVGKWFVLFVILLFVELITINLVTIWFAAGAVAAMISTIFTDSLYYQILVFLVVSFLSLLVTKPFLKKLKKFDIEPTNLDRVVGKTGEVIQEIDVDKNGEVKIFGKIWTAVSKNNIPVGSKVKVLSIDGVKLVVRKEEK